MSGFPTIDEFDLEAKRMYLQWLLKENGYNIVQTARAAGRSRTHLYKLLQHYGVAIKRPPTPKRQIALIHRDLMANLIARRPVPAVQGAERH